MSRRPDPPLPVVKTLYMWSSNVCSYMDPDTRHGCEQELTNPAWDSVMAEICHIRGYRPTSPRHDPDMTDDERDGFDNLLLLCPTHHTVVDRTQPERHPVEALAEMKEKSREARVGGKEWATDLEREALAQRTLARMAPIWLAEEPLDGGGGGADAKPEQAEAVSVQITEENSVDGNTMLYLSIANNHPTSSIYQCRLGVGRGDDLEQSMDTTCPNPGRAVHPKPVVKGTEGQDAFAVLQFQDSDGRTWRRYNDGRLEEGPLPTTP